MARPGRKSAVVLAISAVAVLAFLTLFCHRTLLEQWYLYRLRSDDPEVMVQGLIGLRRFGTERSIPPIFERVRSIDWDRVKDESWSPFLTAVSNDPSWQWPDRVTRYWFKHVPSGDPFRLLGTPTLATTAAIARRRPEESLQILLDGLRHQNKNVGRIAMIALWAIEDDLRPELKRRVEQEAPFLFVEPADLRQAEASAREDAGSASSPGRGWFGRRADHGMPRITGTPPVTWDRQ